MGTHEAYTRLLGLALRGGNLVTGNDAVQAAAYAGQIRLLMISADASPHVCKDVQRWAERGNCLLIALPCDKAELGGALGRGEVAVAALTDTGLAAAVGERLAQLDPARYTDTAERLKRKAERAGERKAARADERKAARDGERKAAKARARPDETPKRKPNAAHDTPKREPGAARNASTRKSTAANHAPKRKTNAETRKPGAARKPVATTRMPDAARKSTAASKTPTRKPAATTRKTDAAHTPTRKTNAARNGKPGAAHTPTRKSGAARNDKPGGTPSGRPPSRAGNPRPRRKHTDT